MDRQHNTEQPFVADYSLRWLHTTVVRKDCAVKCYLSYKQRLGAGPNDREPAFSIEFLCFSVAWHSSNNCLFAAGDGRAEHLGSFL